MKQPTSLPIGSPAFSASGNPRAAPSVGTCLASVIPRSDIGIAIEVDPARLTSASPETVILGIACIHEYENAAFAGATWEGAQEALRVESEELLRLDASCPDEEAFDEAAYEARFECALGFEFGVSGTVEALCAAGCPTFASCGGHGEGSGGRSRHPWVLFAGDTARLLLLTDAARKAGCGLEIDDRGLLTVWAPSVREMVKFGNCALSQRGCFDELPVTVDRVAAQPPDDEFL